MFNVEGMNIAPHPKHIFKTYYERDFMELPLQRMNKCYFWG